MKTKSRSHEKLTIPSEDGCSLCTVIMRPKPSTPTKQVVLIVPLAGASAGSQLLVFRNFARRGSIVICYEYRGHPKSTGEFDLDATITDTRYALNWALDFAHDHQLPLHGFATCYGVIPLLSQFKEGGQGPFLRSVTTVSGLYKLHQIMSIDGFAPYISRHFGREMDAATIVKDLEEGVLDCDAPPLRQALREYLLSLMPELRVELDSFEELRYDNLNMRQMLLQFARADYIRGAKVPESVSCTAVMGRQDWLLSTDTDEGREKYMRLVRAVMPHAYIYDLDMDHYGEGPDHDKMAWAGSDAFERADAAQVTAPHCTEVPHFRSLPR